MKKINLLPADAYLVINKTILTDTDKKNLINLYEPIIGSMAVSLYLTLWSDLDKRELMSKDYNHHHLMTLLKANLTDIDTARLALEAVGLIKTYFKKGEHLSSYLYELYSPLSAYEFFNHPVLNIILYNNLGATEYQNIINLYKKPSFNYDGYEEISTPINQTFKTVEDLNFNHEDLVKQASSKIKIDALIDFDLLIASIPNKILNEKALTKKLRELINNLAFVYNLDTLKMSELLRLTLDEGGMINKNILLKETRKYYEYNHSGNLPTLIYRTQPDHLKSPVGDLSKRGKMLYIFENTTPYDFLRSKMKGIGPTTRDLKLLEYLAVELELPPAIINVLIDYVLRINDNKLNKAFVETIAGQWIRTGVKTAQAAMQLAEKEHKKNRQRGFVKKDDTTLPVWFNQENNTENMNADEAKEIEALLKEFK